MLTEKYKPGSIDQLKGPTKNIATDLRKWLVSGYQNSKFTPKIVVLHGKTGSGKSLVSSLIATNVMPVEIINPTDERNAEALRSLIDRMKQYSFKKFTLYVFEEAEGVQFPKEFTTIINPMLIIVNDKKKVPQWMKVNKENVRFVNLELPSYLAKEEFSKEILTKEGLSFQLSHKVIKYAQCYRDILNNIETYQQEPAMRDTEDDIYETLVKISTGIPIFKSRETPENLCTWIFDNATTLSHREKVAFVDRLLVDLYDNDYRMWKYAYPILHSCKGITSHLPYSFTIKKNKVEEDVVVIKKGKRSDKVVKPKERDLFSF